MVIPFPLRQHGRYLALIMTILCGLFTTACTSELQQLLNRTPSPTTAPFTPPPLPVRTATVQVPSVQATPVPGEELIRLSTEEQLSTVVVPTRDLRDLTLRLNPTVSEIPLVVNQTAPDYPIDTELEFWVHNLDTNSNNQITARLVYKTDVAYVWIEAGQSYNEEAIARSIDRFSEQSYPAAVAFFGSEWYPGVDNDPRLHILHAIEVGSGVAGYYSSADQYSQLANPFSNEKEMFYINLRWLNNTSNYRYYETVLAHEFQHMIHWFNDRNEETWLNEGLSEYAQEVTGYGADTVFANSFIRKPDTQLTTWHIDSSSNAEHYGGSYMFVNYLTQRFGQETTQAVVAQAANGTQGITDALQASGHDLMFDALFADWVIANYVEDPNALGLNGIYGYRDLDLPTPPAERPIFTANVPYAATVSNYATDYIVLPAGDEITFQFQGQKQTRLANTEPHSGSHAWWSHRGDDSNSRLTRKFDLSALPATSAATAPTIEMDVAMWWNIEVDYDYGYVLASRDGQKWDQLEGQQMTRENPSGNSFGIGYTGRSDDWVIERFDLSPYGGGEVWIRFEYVTDDAVNASGWLIDDVRIPAIDYATDFEENLNGWESEGWLLTDNLLSQHWLLQLMYFDDDELSAVVQIPVNADGVAQFDLQSAQRIIAAISALTPVSTESASYTLELQ